MTTEEELRRLLAESPADDTLRGALADLYAETGRPDLEWREREVAYARPVLADPDADAPRLEFADHCERHGLHARAEWIRTALKLGKLAPCPPWCDHTPARCERTRLLNSISDCAAAPGQMWVSSQGLPWYVMPTARPDRNANGDPVAAVHRGFIETVICRDWQWLTDGPDMTLRHPVRDCHLTSVPEVDYSASGDVWLRTAPGLGTILYRDVGAMPYRDVTGGPDPDWDVDTRLGRAERWAAVSALLRRAWPSVTFHLGG